MRRIGIGTSLLALGLAATLAGCITTAEEAAKQDHAYCRSIGATGPAYSQCRMFATVRRDQQNAATRAAIGDALIGFSEGFNNSRR